jgi:NADH:ubiquinone oxidoreductase subunit K
MSIAVSRIAIVGTDVDVLLILTLGAAFAVIGSASVRATRAVISFLFIVPILLNIDRLSIGYSGSFVSNLALYHFPASKSVGPFRP